MSNRRRVASRAASRRQESVSNLKAEQPERSLKSKSNQPKEDETAIETVNG
jgi:hypothetical protein